MKYPKRIILGLGGTHPDFLCACFRLMETGAEIKIDPNGRVPIKSSFKRETRNARFKGIKNLNLSYNYEDTEISHIWYDEYKKFPSKFFIINFKLETLDYICQMFREKRKVNIMEIFDYITPKLANYFKSKNINYEEIFKKFCMDSLKKFHNCKNPEIIEINNIYNKDYVIELLKRNLGLLGGIWEKDIEYVQKFNKFYKNWHHKNKSYIDKINMYYARSN